MLAGKPDAGKLHVRFDEGEQRDWSQAARCSLLYLDGDRHSTLDWVWPSPTLAGCACSRTVFLLDHVFVCAARDSSWDFTVAHRINSGWYFPTDCLLLDLPHSR